jgi:hypothetical protein
MNPGSANCANCCRRTRRSFRTASPERLSNNHPLNCHSSTIPI